MTNPPVHINHILHTVDVDEVEVEDVDEVSHLEVPVHTDGILEVGETSEVDLEEDFPTEVGIDQLPEIEVAIPTEDMIEVQLLENLKKIPEHPIKIKTDVFSADSMDIGKMNAHKSQTRMMKDKVLMNIPHMTLQWPHKNISAI